VLLLIKLFIDADVLSEETLIDYYTDLFCGSKDKIDTTVQGEISNRCCTVMALRAYEE
jgi:hypothetical protein